MSVYFPTGYDEASCNLVPINAALVPYVAGALRLFELESTWKTWFDYEQGYNAIAELEICMANGCIDELIESNRQIYRLLNTALYGQVYTTSVDVDGNPIAVPSIPVAPEIVYGDSVSLVRETTRLFSSVDNGLHGRIQPGYDDERNPRQQLDDLIAAIQAGDGQTQEDILATLVQIAGLLA